MSIYAHVESILNQFTTKEAPLLLALSGGPDSLSLFFCLLNYRTQYGTAFHIAHVDHGWREESSQEAIALKKMAEAYAVPFHLKTLDPKSIQGNLEAVCREARYTFFAQIGVQYGCQAVITGHHRDDRAETIFKQLFEGAHWSCWSTLKPVTLIHGISVLRPLLNISKQEIEKSLQECAFSPFIDHTNTDVRYLRTRMRQTIFPWLNKTFGKNVQNSLIHIADEAEEITSFFYSRLNPLLERQIKGPWGICLDLQADLPSTEIEVKYLLRLFASQQGFIFPRKDLKSAAIAWLKGAANQKFLINHQEIILDRRRLFLLQEKPTLTEIALPLQVGLHQMGKWKLEVKQEICHDQAPMQSWKEAWAGKMRCCLPLGEYTCSLGSLLQATNKDRIKKEWSNAKVPAFLYPYFPLIQQNHLICHEFLSEKQIVSAKKGMLALTVAIEFDEGVKGII